MRCIDNDAQQCKICTNKTILANINLTTNCTNIMTNTTEIRTKSPTTTATEQHNQKASPSSATVAETEDLQQQTMNAEIEAAVTFLTDLIKASQFSTQKAEQFRKALTILLKQYYDGHWYPEEPLRGSGYRCLRVNGVMNPLLKKAAQKCELPLKKFRQAFPVELTVWVDPGDVSVRFGEEGSIGVYYAKAGNCLKHDHQNFEELQRLAASAAAKRTSPPLLTGNNGMMSMGSGNMNSSSRNSPASMYTTFSPFDGKSLKIATPQTPPRKILPFVGAAGGRRTPTPSSSNGFFTQSPYGQQQQQMAYHHGFGSPVVEHQQQPIHQQHHQQHHHQSPPQHQFDFVRRPSPSPSPPETSSYGFSGGFNDWCKSEYQMYGNVHYPTNNQHSYGRFARMMNTCGRQEPVGAN